MIRQSGKADGVRRRLLTSVAVVLGAGALLLSRQAPAGPDGPQASFRAAVDLVQIDVSVLDAQRRPIRGLTAADFTVVDSGTPRPVEAFAEVSLPERSGPAAPWTADVAPDVATNQIPDAGRLVVILFDRSIGPGEPTLTARRVARAAVAGLAPGDLAAVLSTDVLTPQGFTADRARLRRAIDSLNSSAQQSQDQKDQWEGALARVKEQTNLDLPNPPEYLNGRCYCGVCVLDTVTRVADAVREVSSRRKALLFIGSDLLLQTTDECANPLRDARARMMRSLDRANLTVHSIDPSGLETGARMASSNARASLPPLATADLARRRDALSVLPERTGGRVVTNANRPEQAVSAILDETGSYYLLGFKPATADKGAGLRRLEVKVSRRGAVARARKNYEWPAAEVPAVAAPMASAPLRSAIAGLLPTRPFDLALGASSMALPGRDEAAVALVVGLTLNQSQHETTERERFEVVASAFDRLAQPRGTARQVVEVEWPVGPAVVRRIDLLSRLDLVPGDYEIRVAVVGRDPSRAASVFMYVTVPTFLREAVSLSAVSLSVDPSGAAAPKDFLASVLPWTPTSQRDFATATRVTAFVRAYVGDREPSADARVTTKITDVSGTDIVEEHATISAAAFGAARASDLTYLLPVHRLTPGSYLLSIEVATPSGKAVRTARFTVR
jgi:VWFA-related protein